ncbi:membrane-associated tyrosine- and threonine-specific cdc2-inhibitory kinase-like isoform X2 [Limulus polyphemus]|uniref:non-specific serine/threonine protein kinase n=1 Tax=Limulus polyphemus TaxID=6850 RepID=A0ABM1S5E1_LIMPO|nr:membrane-associated tyrosine- and threonine-specific cdc2-inhibitory kinase-like isoform X2 [Limulus polyphemus]
MATLKSPRPTPEFFSDSQTFSTKKARATPRDQLPPRPPVKSAPPVSRLFHNRPLLQRAQVVSFRGSDSFLLSKHYDESSQELYFDQCFQVESKLGAGSFGEVFKVRSKEDGRRYAVKKSRQRFRGESDRQRKLEEVKKHEQLPKHSNCIRFVKAWEEKQHLYIQTELCETSLSNYAEQNHEIPESVVWNYLVDLLLAVKHLHDHNLIHLDIKPANIFISKDGVCKLGDFGLVLDLNKGDISEAIEGDPMYLAPELLEGKFTKAADIFSLGITILELASDLDLPRGGDGWHLLREGRIPLEFLTELSPELKQIIQLMMLPDHRERPSAAELLNLSAVKRILKKRRIQLSCRAVVSAIELFFHWILTCLIWLKNVVTFPVKKLIQSGNIVNVPSSSSRPRILSEWEQSFSDDEVFEYDVINTTNSDLGIPLSDTSTSSESRNGSFFISSIADRLVNSTPAVTRQRHLNKSMTPNHIVTHDWDSYRNSPDVTHNLSVKSQTPYILNSSLHESSLLEDDAEVRAGIGPKNLMNAFDVACSDDSS